jgi:hypothetical protein
MTAGQSIESQRIYYLVEGWVIHVRWSIGDVSTSKMMMMYVVND